jgi:hypothetical protein
MEPLSIPTVNLNGTSALELVEQNMAVVRALRKAIETGRAACPHGRDYQHLIKDRNDWAAHSLAVSNAQDAWRERMSMLSRIANDFEQLAVAISRQVDMSERKRIIFRDIKERE